MESDLARLSSGLKRQEGMVMFPALRSKSPGQIMAGDSDSNHCAGLSHPTALLSLPRHCEGHTHELAVENRGKEETASREQSLPVVFTHCLPPIHCCVRANASQRRGSVMSDRQTD